MKNLQKIWFVIAVIAATWLIKFVFAFPTADISVIGVILSVSSILFGLLAGFYISVLWSRYTEIRSLQGERSSSGLMLLDLALYFYPRNTKFERDLKRRMELACIADETILWDEGDYEEEYYRKVSRAFLLVPVKSPKDEAYFNAMVSQHANYVSTTVKMDSLYRERLSRTDWLLFAFLTITILISVLLLDTSQLFYSLIILTFPVVIYLTLATISDLNTLQWGRQLVTLEPVQCIFDALGVKRFYVERDIRFVAPGIRNYRTEKNLTGEVLKVYRDIIGKRKQKRA